MGGGAERPTDPRGFAGIGGFDDGGGFDGGGGRPEMLGAERRDTDVDDLCEAGPRPMGANSSSSSPRDVGARTDRYDRFSKSSTNTSSKI